MRIPHHFALDLIALILATNVRAQFYLLNNYAAKSEDAVGAVQDADPAA